MIEYVHSDRQLFTAMQVTPENLRPTNDVDEWSEAPMSDWVIAATGCDGLWGGGDVDCDIAFDDSCGRDWYRGSPHADYDDWLVRDEDGLFFFVPQHVFEILFEVEGANICRECRLIPEKHTGWGRVPTRSGTSHSSDCPTVAWMKSKPGDAIPFGRGFRNDPPCQHDVIG